MNVSVATSDAFRKHCAGVTTLYGTQRSSVLNSDFWGLIFFESDLGLLNNNSSLLFFLVRGGYRWRNLNRI